MTLLEHKLQWALIELEGAGLGVELRRVESQWEAIIDYMQSDDVTIKAAAVQPWPHQAVELAARKLADALTPLMDVLRACESVAEGRP